MTVSVKCPTCGQELLAAAELVGKLALCPQCQTHFPVTKSVTRTASGPAATEPRQSVSTAASAPVEAAAPSAPPGSVPVGKPLQLAKAPSMLQPAGGAPAPPPAPPAGESRASGHATVAGHAPPPKSPPTLPSTDTLYPPGQSPPPTANSNLASVTRPPAPSAGSPASAPQPARRPSSKPFREAQPARFIPADASATRVELGHDGQLPVLHLEEATRADADEKNAQSSNPWLLVIAMMVSFGLSAVFLFVDFERAPVEQTTKRSARRDIELYYSRPAPRPQRYRQLLREALQAYNKGDYAKERRRYKQVLDLLHAENKDPYSGLTGQVNAAQPPHDRHLEELLSTLVND